MRVCARVLAVSVIAVLSLKAATPARAQTRPSAPSLNQALAEYHSGDRTKAVRLLAEIFERLPDSSRSDLKLDVAVLLSLVPPGHEAYADRSKYSEYALAHPAAHTRLTENERFRILRALAQGWFDQAKWKEARATYENVLLASRTLDDQILAVISLGWIELNERKPGEAVTLWLRFLEQHSDIVSAAGSAPLGRDLGRAWVEACATGAGTASEAMRAMTLLQKNEDALAAFHSGLAAGIRRAWAVPPQRSELLRRVGGAPELASRIRDVLLLTDTDLLDTAPCEILPWLPENSAALKSKSGPILRKALVDCWRTTQKFVPQDLALLLMWLQSSDLSGRDRSTIAEIAIKIQDWDLACREYVQLAAPGGADATNKDSIAAAAFACIRAGEVERMALAAKIPVSDPTYLPLAQAHWSVLKTAEAKARLLAETFPEPAAGVEPSARLWWLDAAQTLPQDSPNRPQAARWATFFVIDPLAFRELPLSPEVRTLARLDLATRFNLGRELLGRSSHLEKDGHGSRKFDAAYHAFLSRIASDPDPIEADGEIARHYGAVHTLIRGPLDDVAIAQLRRLLANRRSTTKSDFMSSASLIVGAMEKLRRSSEVSLSLRSSRFVAVLKRKLTLLDQGLATLRGVPESQPALRELARRTADDHLRSFQETLRMLDAPVEWPDAERQAWGAQRELIIAKIVGVMGARL